MPPFVAAVGAGGPYCELCTASPGGDRYRPQPFAGCMDRRQGTGLAHCRNPISDATRELIRLDLGMSDRVPAADREKMLGALTGPAGQAAAEMRV